MSAHPARGHDGVVAGDAGVAQPAHGHDGVAGGGAGDLGSRRVHHDDHGLIIQLADIHINSRDVFSRSCQLIGVCRTWIQLSWV